MAKVSKKDKSKTTKTISWKELGKEFLKPLKDLPRKEVEAKVKEKTGIVPDWKAFLHALANHDLQRKRTDGKEKKKKLGETELKLLEVLSQAPEGLPISLLCEKTGISQRGAAKKIQQFKGLLEEKDFVLSINESKKTVTVGRKGFENLEPKIIEIKTDVATYKAGANVGLFAGPFYGSDGYRDGLIELNAYVEKRNNVHFVALLGLVDGRDLEDQIKAKFGFRSKNQEYKYWEDLFVSQIARELTICLPIIKKPDGNLVKVYISTSPIVDKDIGARIAHSLSELRKDDVIYFGSKNDHPLLVKYIGEKGKTLLPATIQKSHLPSKYASTKPQGQHRKLLKILKASDVLVFGGYGVFIHKPAAGEIKRPYIGLPTLHAISERETRNDSESEVGTRVIKYRPDGNYTVTASDFKYLMRRERELIKPTPSASDIQKKIIEILKERATFAGVLADRLGIPREKIKKEIEELVYFRAGITYDPASRLYDFSKDWFQKKIRYTWPESFSEEAIVSFACLHTLATYPADGRILTDVKFVLDQLPNYILETKAIALVGAGDFIQGSKVHNLHLRGEVFQGLGLTTQERVAAYLVEKVLMKVFDSRFADFMKGKKPEELTKEKLLAALEWCLVTFVYCAGNHDLWQTGDAVRALYVFLQDLMWSLVRDISQTLQKYSLNIDFLTLAAFLSGKIIRDWPDEKIRYTTPAGITTKTVHPHTPRSETASISEEKLLSQHDSAQYIISGNWHVAFDMQQSDEKMGFRHIVADSTLLLRTFFEDNKMKRTDFGVNVSWLRSDQGRLYEVESGFWGNKVADGYERENNARMETILHELNEDIFSAQYNKKST